MVKNNVGEWDLIADNNTDVGGLNIAEGAPAANMNDALREMMAQLREFYNREVSTVETFSGNYTAVLTDRSKLLHFTAAATLSLTAAATLTNGWFIYVLADGGDVTVDPNLSETIDGSTTFVIPDGELIRVHCDGTGFYTLNSIIRAGSVGTDEIADNAVTSAKIPPDAVGQSELAPNSVGATQIQTGAVGSSEIASNAVNSSEIASGAVGNSELASNAVTSAKIANGTITGSDIGSNTITSGNLASNSVGSSEIASGAVGNSELASNAVTLVKMANDSVGLAEITADAETSLRENNVFTSSSSSATSFPIGHVIWVTDAGGSILRNGLVTPRLHTGQVGEYISGGTGLVVSGTWRNRGGQDQGRVFQRTA